MTHPASSTRPLWRAALLAALLSLSPWVVQAQPDDVGSSGGPSWNSLSSAQRDVLAPLGKDWSRMPAENRAKWMEVASRFPKMSPQQQERIQQRMGEWSSMSPQQRSAARQNYQQSKQLSATDRRADWEAYQALPSEERKALAARRAAAGNPPQAPTGARSLRMAPMDAQAPKSNIVNARPDRPLQQPVSPSTVQGSAGGATTSLVTRNPPPPAHQQVGQPKINTRPDRVDRATLLPKRGPGGAQQRGRNGGNGDGR
ncbi:DUF3106 domain-containing protein [Ideonella sp.]|uniref:DUF3106 domain-containing protein n=1 Tax=Ideonella sp. TaxID=1929293 RepID=UPI00351B602F